MAKNYCNGRVILFLRIFHVLRCIAIRTVKSLQYSGEATIYSWLLHATETRVNVLVLFLIVRERNLFAVVLT